MRAQELTTTQVGDTLALRTCNTGVTHVLLTVARITATQVCCTNFEGRGDWRFRKSDGKQIGQDYRYAELATPELIEKLEQQKATESRISAARQALNDLEGKHLHQLKLTLEQLEALAMAWTAIKAMKPTA